MTAFEPRRSVKLTCSVAEERGRYVLTCLVFPECRGEGATLEEAKASVAEAIRRHVAELGRGYVPPPGAELRYVEI